MSYQVPRGTKDILPVETEKWQAIERLIQETCSLYQYKEIRTPMFEHTELFLRSVGDTTDIVQKEMYTFTDRGDRSLTLRPEGTAAVVRAYVEHKMFGIPDQPVKLYYMGPMFRYERQQAGRYRQFTQFGVEAIGSADPAIDAEVISLAMDICKIAGLKSLKLVINSLGDAESRASHKESLVKHFKPSIDEFCQDCQNRLEKNPLRILDCKVDRNHPLMNTAPALSNYLNEESKQYFDKVKEYLTVMGLEFEVDVNLVRGLDYYTHTAFEIMSTAEGFGAITTLCGGGRYNGLVEDIGGPTAPGIGFGMGVDRILLAQEAEGVPLPKLSTLNVYVVALGEEAKTKAVELVRNFRLNGISADLDYMDRKMKAQMKSADRLTAENVLIIGEEELNEGSVVLKNMTDGTQQKVLFEELLSVLKRN